MTSARSPRTSGVDTPARRSGFPVSVPAAQLDPRLAEFVDREEEMNTFGRFLERDDRPIMVVCGQNGTGKSWLLLKMMHECALRGLRKAAVVWRASEDPDYLLTLRKLRDAFDAKAFAQFTDLVNFYTDAAYKPQLKITVEVQGPIDVARNLQQAGGTIGDIGGIVVKDNWFQVPRSDIAVSEQERSNNLTARFLECLARIVARETAVVFLDGIERMTATTDAWLWEQFLDPVRCGLFPKLRVVVCGDRPARTERDWEMVTTEAQLRPLGHAHVSAYIERRVPGLDEVTRAALADLILANSQGIPAEVAKQVLMFTKMHASRAGGSR